MQPPVVLEASNSVNFVAFLCRPYIRAERPGWGHVYRRFVGDARDQIRWKNATPRIIRDKRNGYFRVLALSEWADRLFYFLGRWYDLGSAEIIRIAIRPGDTVLDVGANYGHFTMAAAAATGPTGLVISAEPNPVSFTRLQMHLALNGLAQAQPHNIGVSSTPGELVLSVPRDNSGEASFAGSAYDDVTKVTCPVTTADDLAGDRGIDFLKIDVEGFEVEVLRGAARILERDRPLVLTEVIDDHLRRAGVTRDILFNTLTDQGYVPYRVCLTKGRGRYDVALEPFERQGAKGDALWVPPERRDRVETLLRGKAKV